MTFLKWLAKAYLITFVLWVTMTGITRAEGLNASLLYGSTSYSSGLGTRTSYGIGLGYRIDPQFQIAGQ